MTSIYVIHIDASRVLFRLLLCRIESLICVSAPWATTLSADHPARLCSATDGLSRNPPDPDRIHRPSGRPMTLFRKTCLFARCNHTLGPPAETASGLDLFNLYRPRSARRSKVEGQPQWKDEWVCVTSGCHASL